MASEVPGLRPMPTRRGPPPSRSSWVSRTPMANPEVRVSQRDSHRPRPTPCQGTGTWVFATA